MAKPTKWEKARDGLSETRTTRNNYTLHRQWTPAGVEEHVSRRDGSTIHLPNPTTDPTKTK